MSRGSTRPGMNGSGGALASSLRHLVESVTERVWSHMRKDLISRAEIRALEREVRALARKVDTVRLHSDKNRVGRPRLDRKCRVGGCGLPHVAQGFCSKHYQAWRRRTMNGAAPTAAPARRSAARV